MEHFLFNIRNNLQINFALENFAFYMVPMYLSQNHYLPEKSQAFFTPSGYEFNYSNSEFTNFQPNLIFPANTESQDHQANSIQVEEMRKKQKKIKKQIQSARKNSESNITNNFFSFINHRGKSLKTIESCISTFYSNIKEEEKEKLIYLFYNAAYLLNARKSRKYVSKKNMFSLFYPEKLLMQVPQIEQKIIRAGELLPDILSKLSQIFRKCCYYFLKTESIHSILTSKRISKNSKKQHIKRRRKLIIDLQEILRL